jgi:hypothetical protein
MAVLLLFLSVIGIRTISKARLVKRQRMVDESAALEVLREIFAD